MPMKKILSVSLLLSTVSCSQFHIGRSHLSEMEHDDSTFFHPEEDFPIVAGDTGRSFDSESDRESRAPASESERMAEKNRRFLKLELRRLESEQSDPALAHYDRYKKHLATTSEKIYFLKLSPYERKEYLASRGFMNSERSPSSVSQSGYAPRSDSNLSPGMSKDDVMTSMGQPARVEIAGNPSFENERWQYKMNGASKYIYFESGRVQGWE